MNNQANKIKNLLNTWIYGDFSFKKDFYDFIEQCEDETVLSEIYKVLFFIHQISQKEKQSTLNYIKQEVEKLGVPIKFNIP